MALIITKIGSRVEMEGKNFEKNYLSKIVYAITIQVN